MESSRRRDPRLDEEDLMDEEEDEDFSDDEEDMSALSDDDIDEDGEDTERGDGPPKKKARRLVSQVLDLEAEASSDEEDDENEFDEEDAGFVVDGNEILDNQEYRQDRADYQRIMNRRLHDKSAEDMVRGIEERYKQYAMQEELDTDSVRQLSQHSLQPTIKDPRLWSVRVKPGMEREIAFALMNKFLIKSAEGDSIPIYSVVSMDHLKGYIYVEAFKEAHVRDFVAYINGVFVSRIKLVALNEMVSVITVPKTKFTLKAGDWVRIKRGVYKNDLGQVYDYEESKTRAWVKLVPRLDLEKLEKRARGEEVADGDDDDDGAQGKKRTRAGKVRNVRPPARLFNEDEVRSGSVETVTDQVYGTRFQVYQNRKFRDGFIYMNLKVNSLVVDNVVPTLEELQIFQGSMMSGASNKDTDASNDEGGLGAGRDIDERRQVEQSKQMTQMQAQRVVHFEKGDAVIVSEGELKNLIGVVHSVKGNTIEVRPTKENYSSVGIVAVPRAQLKKHFLSGDHVKVLNGKFSGETGLIVKLDDAIAVVLSDISHSEMKVLRVDLQKTQEVATGAKFGEFSLYDLIHLNSNDVAVIIRIEGDQAVVLDANDKPRTVNLQAVSRRRDTRQAIGRDKDNEPVAVGSKVKVIAGNYTGEVGTVKHVFKIFSFVHIPGRQQNAGLLCVRSRSLQLVGTSLNKQQQLQHGAHGNRNAIDQRFTARATTRSKRSDPLLHKTVTITRGPYKGHMGLVKDTTTKDATVELNATGRRVSVPRTQLYELEEPKNLLGGEWDVTKTPMRGDQTPMRPGSQTPMRPSTPGHDPFNPNAPQTPMHPGSSYEPGAYVNQYGSNTGSMFDNPATPNLAPYGTPGTPGFSMDAYATPSTPGAASNFPASVAGSYASPYPATPAGGASYASPYSPAPPMTPGAPSDSYSTPYTPAPPMTPGGASSAYPYSPAPPSTPGAPSYPSPYSPAPPATPGGAPSYTPYTPATPGASSAYPYSPAPPSTPGAPGSYISPYSPAPGTPGGASGAYTTPYSPAPTTPGAPSGGPGYGGMYSPAPTTPGGSGGPSGYNTPYSPATPGGVTDYGTPGYPSDAAAPGAPDYGGYGYGLPPGTGPTSYSENEGQYKGKMAVVTEVNGQKCTVDILNDQFVQTGTLLKVPTTQLSPVPPDKRHMVIVINGENKGSTGSLMGIDDKEGILSLNDNVDNVCVLRLTNLAKYLPA